MESSKNVLSISVENPMVISLSLSSVMYTQYIPVFILLFFRFDDDTKLDDGVKLKKRDFGDVPYLEKSVSYLQETLNQIGINEEKVAIPALFPVSLRISAGSRAEGKVAILALPPPFEGYFPIFFSLEMTLYSEGDMP